MFASKEQSLSILDEEKKKRVTTMKTEIRHYAH